MNQVRLFVARFQDALSATQGEHQPRHVSRITEEDNHLRDISGVYRNSAPYKAQDSVQEVHFAKHRTGPCVGRTQLTRRNFPPTSIREYTRTLNLPQSLRDSATLGSSIDREAQGRQRPSHPGYIFLCHSLVS